MANEDLSKLTIEKNSSATPAIRKRRPSLAVAIIIAALLLAFLLAKKMYMPTVEIETATVSQVYPSQSLTLLNASGYVVAQRKAAVASKITGRLISLSVEEGNRIRKGDIIARLENEDMSAIKERAAANLKVAGANLDQAKSELVDAATN
jgi:multidrug efflux pump subunit AcrA (membrane-fusion protein)